MAAKKRKSKESTRTVIWPFGKRNYVLFGVALGVIILGYIFLGWGDDPNNAVSLTLAPIVLIIGYALVPVAILVRDPEITAADEAAEAAETE